MLVINDMRLTTPDILGCLALFLDQRVQLSLCGTGTESFRPLEDAELVAPASIALLPIWLRRAKS